MNSRSVVLFLGLTLVAGPQFSVLRAQSPSLQADVATAKEIEFSWAGNPPGDCSLQRKTGSTPVAWAPVAKSSEGKAADTKISAEGTYVYRVMCGAKISNEVTVGPPPAGFHTIMPRPANHPDTALGRFISPVLDSNGDPAVAFVYNNPSGDGKGADTQLMFVSWDRATYSWKEPVVVATVGNFDPRPPAPCVSLTRDPQTDAYGIAWVDGSDMKTVHMALSHDDGATWSVKTAFANGQTSAGPTLIFSGGKAYLTLEQDKTMNVIYTSGGIDEDPYQWHGGFAPLLPGNNGVSRASSLALDDHGVPAIAYWQKANNGSVWTLTFWRPTGSGAPVKVADNGTSNYPPDGVILTFAGEQPRIMLDARIDRTQISSHYSVFSSDAGATWSKPLPVPDDGNEHIGGYMSFAVSKNGSAAFAGDVVGGNTDHMKCSWPKLARSKSLTEWDTCAPQGAKYPMIRTTWGTVIYSPGGLLYVLFQNHQTNPAQGLPAGLLIWAGQ